MIAMYWIGLMLLLSMTLGLTDVAIMLVNQAARKTLFRWRRRMKSKPVRR